MKKSKFVFFIFLLLLNFFLVDFPAAKITITAIITIVLVSYFYTQNVKKKIHLRRFMDTYKVFSGLTENTSLIITNNSSLPIHSLKIVDYADLNISVEQTHYFDFSVDGHNSALENYPVYGRKRGKFKVGPSYIRFTDILGLYSFELEVNTIKEVIIFPNILQVSNMSYKSMQPYGAIKNKIPIFEDPTIMVGLKEYVYGDEIKRINWKVSARYDKLYVNTYQPSISSGSIIILDMKEENYPLRNRDYYIEQGVEICASLVRELFILRQEVGFASNCKFDKLDTLMKTNVAKGEAHFTSVLTDLALIEPTDKINLNTLLDPSLLNLTWGTSFYLVTTQLDEVSIYKLIDFYQSGHSVTIINIGPEIKKDLSLWNIGFQCFYAEIDGDIIHLMRI